MAKAENDAAPFPIEVEKRQSGSASSDDGLDRFPHIAEKALLRKLDRKLLPPLTLLYLLSFLDRSNGWSSSSGAGAELN